MIIINATTENDKFKLEYEKNIAKNTWQDPEKREIGFKDISLYTARQVRLTEGYLCSYFDRDRNLQVYDHDAFYERNKDKIDNNKSWNNPRRQEVTDGQKKEATLRWRKRISRFRGNLNTWAK